MLHNKVTSKEASFIIITDGTNVVPLATSQDHKARDDGDTGPNTGGMGAYSPAPVITEEIERRILNLVIHPTLKGLRQDGINYTGFLYAGLMITAEGIPKVIEFNCRLGDPETQPIMARLQSDLVSVCKATLEGQLAEVTMKWDPRKALGVVMAAGGYPTDYATGKSIEGLNNSKKPPTKIFHAGTKFEGNAVVTNGGRVLCVVSLGHTVADAYKNVYQQVDAIHWDQVYYRKDIGHRAITREQS